LKVFCVLGKELSDKLHRCSFNQTLKNHVLGNHFLHSDVEFWHHVPSVFSAHDRA